MELISRRDAGRILMAGAAGLMAGRAGLSGATKIDSKVRGVQIGAQSYSFRDRALDPCIEAYKTVGLGECELWSGHLEPRGLKPPEVRKWHLTVPLSHFQDVRQKFDNAGITLFAYTYGFRKDFTDEEIERGFQEAKALGVRTITSSANVSTAARVDKFAVKYGINRACAVSHHPENSPTVQLCKFKQR